MQIVVNVKGGPYDGVPKGDGQNHNQLATQWWFLTHQGQIGKRFKTIPPTGMEMMMQGRSKELGESGMIMAVYEIVARKEDGDTLTLTAQYHPEGDEGDRE
jgi:hypothetical protein